jgi:hypothetical protein
MSNHAARLFMLASLCAAAAAAAAPAADAATRFDGRWSAVLRTKSGPCQPAYRGAVQVVDGVLEVGGATNALSGRVSPSGAVRATGYTGSNYGIATGRLSGNYGSGTWRARMEYGNCSGVWTAQRQESR